MKTIEILLNGCYGGFHISKLAIVEYNKIKTEKDINYKESLDEYDYYNSLSIKTDLDMIEVIKKLGVDANGTYSKIIIETINYELLNYIQINEYDGRESLSFKINK